jgi:hypothetical protein
MKLHDGLQQTNYIFCRGKEGTYTTQFTHKVALVVFLLLILL